MGLLSLQWVQGPFYGDDEGFILLVFSSSPTEEALQVHWRLGPIPVYGGRQERHWVLVLILQHVAGFWCGVFLLLLLTEGRPLAGGYESRGSWGQKDPPRRRKVDHSVGKRDDTWGNESCSEGGLFAVGGGRFLKTSSAALAAFAASTRIQPHLASNLFWKSPSWRCHALKLINLNMQVTVVQRVRIIVAGHDVVVLVVGMSWSLSTGNRWLTDVCSPRWGEDGL